MGIKNKAMGLSAAVLIALPFTGHFEGLRLNTYLDVGGVPTICYGETKNVSVGQEKTKKECDFLFATRLGWFSRAVTWLVRPEVPPKTHAALTSFTYNIGVNGFARSRTLKLINQGHLRQGCRAMMGWYKAGGKDCRVRENRCYGLIVRREAEINLCLDGLNHEIIKL